MSFPNYSYARKIDKQPKSIYLLCRICQANTDTYLAMSIRFAPVLRATCARRLPTTTFNTSISRQAFRRGFASDVVRLLCAVHSSCSPTDQRSHRLDNRTPRISWAVWESLPWGPLTIFSVRTVRLNSMPESLDPLHAERQPLWKANSG